MKTALIFAAGRGERLKPITDRQPKALCTIKGISLIEHHVRNLAKAGIHKIVINHAHLGGMIRQELGNGQQWNVDIIYSPEPPGGLETGGTIVFTKHLLGDSPFITVNADIFTDFDFSKLTLSPDQQANLILIDKPKYYSNGDFGISDDHLLLNENKHYTFSGVACYRPSLFTALKPGRFSLTPLLRQWVSEKKIYGEVHQGSWIDIGTKERLDAINHG